MKAVSAVSNAGVQKLPTSEDEALPVTAPQEGQMPAVGSPTRTRLAPVGESIIRGALAMLSTQPLTWTGSLLTAVAIPRLLGSESLGQYTIAFTIASLAGLATNLGISEYLVRRIAQQPTTLRSDLGVALLVQMLVTVFGAAVIAGLGPLGVFPVTDPRLLLLALLGMLIVPGQTVLLSAFRGREQHKQYAWFNAAVVVLGQVGGVLALFAGADVLVYAGITGIATIAVTLFGWKLAGVRPIFPVLDRALLREFHEFIRGGFPFWVFTLTLSITSGIDRVLLGLFVPAAEVGWYAAAFRIIAIPLFIPTLIITPLFPALSRSANESETVRRSVAMTLRVVLLLMVPLSAGTIVVAPAIPALLGWPSDFENAVPLMAILSLQLPLVAVDMVLGVVLMAIGRQGAWTIVGLLASPLKIGLNILAIPIFESQTGNGAIGASVVTLLTELVMLFGALILLPKHLLDLRIAWETVRILVAGVATVLVGMALLPIALALSVCGAALIYVVVVVLLRALTMDDVRTIKSSLSSRAH